MIVSSHCKYFKFIFSSLIFKFEFTLFFNTFPLKTFCLFSTRINLNSLDFHFTFKLSSIAKNAKYSDVENSCWFRVIVQNKNFRLSTEDTEYFDHRKSWRVLMNISIDSFDSSFNLQNTHLGYWEKSIMRTWVYFQYTSRIKNSGLDNYWKVHYFFLT